MTRRYASVVKLMAEDPQLSGRIGAPSRLGPDSQNVQCALADNFNMDPLTEEATAYAARALTVSARCDAIRSTVEGLTLNDFEVAPVNDRECEIGNAYVRSKQLPIRLCFGFFVEVPRRPSTILHEVAHLRGMSDIQYLKGKEEGVPARVCLKGSRFSIDADDAIHNPDSYAYFAADLGGPAVQHR